MDQENSMDFKALRARFQEEDLLLKQPKFKPALPDKPKVVPPPTSPTHYLPAGARPSLLTSINQTLDGRSQVAPRVVFKDEKKESKKPLIQNHSKSKEKSEGKLKKGKEKSSKGSKEKLNEDPSDEKPKKESRDKKISSLFAPKDNAAELVPASPPPKNTATKKKGFLGFKKSAKKDSVGVISDPILDSPSPDVPGPLPLIPAPLIPVPSDFGDAPEPELSPLKALLPNIPPLPESVAAVEVTPPSITPETPDFTRPPSSSPAAPQSETCLQGETPALHVSRPPSQNDFSPPSAVPTPPPSRAAPPTASPAAPEPLAVAEPDIEAVIRAAVEKPPEPVEEPPSKTSSPKAEHPVSVLSALERAEELSPGKRTPTFDQRIFNALEKARKKTPSSLSNLTPSTSVTPPPEEFLPPQSPTPSLPELPPIDYEAGNPALLNGLDHAGAASPVLEGITEEGSDPIPELLVVPPPPPKKILPDPESLGLAPEKPDRPPSVDLSPFIPPPPVEDIPVPVEFSETDTTDVPEFDDVTSDTHSPELQVSEWGNRDHRGPDSPDGQNPPDLYSNRIFSPGAVVHAAPSSGENPLPASVPISQESPPPAGVSLAMGNGLYESTEDVYEDIGPSSTKKKGKTDGKKRKGPPKNPYAEAAQEASEEKSKTGRFCKNDKKASAEGPDEKELKKKEKQRQEKERKEQKEKQEREKKEQKEREKKENEMKKKFKITGQEDAMYEATVTVTTKGRKNDLPVNSGENISIIRTTNCPKGKWLAKDRSNNYGYVAVDHVSLDIQEMLNMGKKAANSRKSNNNNNNDNEAVETEVIRTGSRSSNHFPLSAESFTDDSEEWTGDDDELLTPPPNPTDPQASMGHTRTLSMPDMGNKELNVNHQHSHSDINPDGTHVQARHEALQKLATFFHAPKPVEPAASSTEPEAGPAPLREEAADLPGAGSNVKQELDFDQSDFFILPPPDLYADLTVE